jgi:hypothetical protein
MASGDDIGLKVRIETEADASGLDQAKSSLGDLSGEVRGAGREVRALGSAGLGLERAMTGLRIGGVQGLVIALRGLGMTIRAVSLTMTGSFIGMAALVFAPIAAAILLIKHRADEMAAAVVKALTEQKATADAYHKKVEEIDKAEKTWLTGQIKLVEQLAEKWNDLSDAMGRTDKAARALEDAQVKLDMAKLDQGEQLELSKAKTPGEESAIKDKFARRRGDVTASHESWERDQTLVRAGLKNEAAQQQLDENKKLLDAAESRARKLEKVAGAEVGAKQAMFGADWESTLTTEERNKFLTDKVAAEEARKSADELGDKQKKLNKELTAATEDYGTAQKVANVERETAEVSGKARQTGYSNKERKLEERAESPAIAEAQRLEEEQAQLQQEADKIAAAKYGTYAPTSPGQFAREQAVGDRLKEVSKQLEEAHVSIDQFAAASTHTLRKSTSAIRRHEDQQRNMRDQIPPTS